MSNLDDFAAPDSEPLDVATSEEGDGHPHFDVGDGPPGADSTETETDGPSDEVSGSGAEVKPIAAAAPPAEFFSFRTADGTTKTFRSADEAQQFFGSWNGRLSKAEKDLREATQANFEWQRAYESGELFQTAQGSQPKKDEPTAPAKEDGILTKVDWKYVTELLQKGQSDKALQYLAYANGEYLKQQVEGIRKEFQGEIEGLTAPARFQTEVSNALQYVVESAFAAVDDMGQPLFPEFHEGSYDANFVKHFRDIWFNQDVNLAVDPNLTGLRAAYYEAKATYRPPQRTTAAPPAPGRPAAPNAPLPPRAPDGTFMKRNAALAMSGPEGPGPAPAGAPQSREAALLEGMRNAGKPRSKFFAVDPD